MATVWRTPCAFARLFLGKPSPILNNATDLGAKWIPESLSVTCGSRTYSSYADSPFVRRIKENYEYEVVKNPPGWAYVERLLPLETIPPVKPKDNYPSGFIPPKEDATNWPFFIPRSKNHELPIYLNITFRGNRKISMIRKIEGDIWLMNDEVKAYLKDKRKKYVETRVHEPARTIEVKGDYILYLREWAYSKGF